MVMHTLSTHNKEETDQFGLFSQERDDDLLFRLFKTLRFFALFFLGQSFSKSSLGLVLSGFFCEITSFVESFAQRLTYVWP